MPDPLALSPGPWKVDGDSADLACEPDIFDEDDHLVACVAPQCDPEQARLTAYLLAGAWQMRANVVRALAQLESADVKGAQALLHATLQALKPVSLPHGSPSPGPAASVKVGGKSRKR